MFNSQNVGERGGSRPLVVGLVLLLLFLSTAQDWGAPPRSNTRSQLKGGQPRDVAKETKEVIIKNLVKSNEDLEKENGKLRLELFQLRSELKTRRSMNEEETEEADRKLPETQTDVSDAGGRSSVEETVSSTDPKHTNTTDDIHETTTETEVETEPEEQTETEVQTETETETETSVATS